MEFDLRPTPTTMALGLYIEPMVLWAGGTFKGMILSDHTKVPES